MGPQPRSIIRRAHSVLLPTNSIVGPEVEEAEAEEEAAPAEEEVLLLLPPLAVVPAAASAVSTFSIRKA